MRERKDGGDTEYCCVWKAENEIKCFVDGNCLLMLKQGKV